MNKTHKGKKTDISNKMLAKIISLIAFFCMDIGFIPRFVKYSIENKITALVFYLITIWIIRSIIKELKMQKNINAKVNHLTSTKHRRK